MDHNEVGPKNTPSSSTDPKCATPPSKFENYGHKNRSQNPQFPELTWQEEDRPEADESEGDEDEEDEGLLPGAEEGAHTERARHHGGHRERMDGARTGSGHHAAEGASGLAIMQKLRK